jgi:hypothetical protein
VTAGIPAGVDDVALVAGLVTAVIGAIRSTWSP